MNGDKVVKFMQLAGQKVASEYNAGDAAKRELGARLLCSEVLEYLIKGLGVVPEINGVKITEPDAVTYTATKEPDLIEMIDGLSDVAYTMYWNAIAFGMPLEEAYDLVCDNNLEKFVKLENWTKGECDLDQSQWHCDMDVTWTPDVVRVHVMKVGSDFYAVGKDSGNKVRKPSCYRSVDLTKFVGNL